MSHESSPISPARFAAALKDLPMSTLHLKAAELRNSIAHLDYSNEQLKPFADGTSPTQEGGESGPDQDCVDAIRENEIVIARMQERIELLKEEVESRGGSWTEFLSPEEVAQAESAKVNGEVGHERDEAGDVEMQGGAASHQAWTDGTFQTGRIVNGEVHMNGGGRVNGTGGTLDDENLRRALDERMRELSGGGEGEDGMHL